VESRSYPVVVIDSHNQSPITCLYIAYSSARRAKQHNMTGGNSDNVVRTNSQNLASAISLDSGGHLIACSEDGTISITNMNSGDIVHKLSHYSTTRNEREKKRIEEFMKSKEQKKRMQRSQSIGSHISVKRYFNLVRAHPIKVFGNCSFGHYGRLSDIVEV
jgi:WD40 repeat protein